MFGRRRRFAPPPPPPPKRRGFFSSRQVAVAQPTSTPATTPEITTPEPGATPLPRTSGSGFGEITTPNTDGSVMNIETDGSVMNIEPRSTIPATTPNTGMKKGGKVSSASKRADGIAKRGKTKGKML